MGATFEGIVGQADSGAPRSAAALGAALRDARGHTLRSYAHLTEREQQFPRLPTVNPPRWEVAHIGWFQEFWCRRYSNADPRGSATPSRLAGADAWLDSRSVPHDIRWDLPIPAWDGIHAYLRDTLDDTLTGLARTGDGERYFFELALYHEDMHGEALLMTLQSLALPPPANLRPRRGRPRVDGDLPLPGGAFVVGTAPSEGGRFRVRQREARARGRARAVRDLTALRG